MQETKSQHYLPRFLLNRFASRSKGDEYFTWCFHKDRKPYEPNTKGIAAERFFYGKAAETSIEAELGIREASYASLLRKISSSGKTDTNQILMLSEFIANLLIRTRHLRMGFSQTFEHITRDAIQTALEHPRIKSLISIVAQLGGGATFPGPLSGRGPESVSQEQNVIDSLHRAIDIDSRVKEFPDLARQAQVSALETKHPERTRQLAGLKWEVLQREHVILGDVGLIVYDKDGGRFKPGTSYNHEGNEYLLLPIDSSTLIVGSASSDRFEIDDEQINVASSKLSEQFFISSTNSAKESYLYGLLGSEFEKWSRFYKEKTSSDWPQDLT